MCYKLRSLGVRIEAEGAFQLSYDKLKFVDGLYLIYYMYIIIKNLSLIYIYTMYIIIKNSKNSEAPDDRRPCAMGPVGTPLSAALNLR